MGKDSFILYTEQLEILEQLDDADVGKIMKAIFEYQKTGKLPTLSKELKAIFMSFKIVLDKNAKKWDETKQKRSAAGKRGMAKRWSDKEVDDEPITNDNKNNKAITNDNKNNKAITNDNKAITNDNKNNKLINEITKITGNVNVNVNDNVNVNVNDKEKIKRKSFIPPSYNDVDEYIKLKQLNVDAKQFYDYFTEGGWKDSKGNQVKNWKQKLLTWNKFAVTTKDEKKKVNFNQRQYDDLNSLYANI